ncbi:MAG: glutamate decarboxylase [Aeriscardovia sp.]|nr:glutamate decarboxylase [Aeriscardovia sp.]
MNMNEQLEESGELQKKSEEVLIEKEASEINATEENVLSSVEAGMDMPTEFMPLKATNPNIVEELIRQYRLNEAKPNQNLTTFCTTQMEPQATRLITEALNTNAIDKSEYPKTAAIEDNCVAMIGHMWNIPADEKFRDDFIGTSTVGSSEGCMLGGLAMLFTWKHRAEKAGMDVNDLHTHRPNLIIDSGYQVVWEKFCTYWNVEMRQVDLKGDEMSMDVDKAMSMIDENTIGIVGIQGITYTGAVDDIKLLDEKLTVYNETHKDMPVHIHVDAAYCGFFAPFVDGFEPWDFRLKNVYSINVSGHKYGMVYPGVGWVVWRKNTPEYLPEEMRFAVAYLGKSVDSIAINFSHSGAQIVGQYYNLVRFGVQGYRAIMNNVRRVSEKISKAIADAGYFSVLTDGSKLPIITWEMSKDVHPKWSLYDMQDQLLMHGWQVPAYPLPKDREDEIVQRIVVRPAMSMTIADDFIADFKSAIEELNKKRLFD